LAIFDVENIKLAGIAASLPNQKVHNMDFPFIPVKEKEILIKNIGVKHRWIALDKTTASDLCYEAAHKLINKLEWDEKDISVLIFVSQTPDFITPGTAPILQNRLNLPKNCIAFDINMGCSGYLIGLAAIASLLQNIPDGKGLLLVGDKMSQFISEKDKSTAMLFSDAGSATAVTNSKGAKKFWFDINTDGSNYDAIMVKDGGGRHPYSDESLIPKIRDNGIIKSDLNLLLKGIDIFNFALGDVVPSISNFLNFRHYSVDEIDYFVFHQANKIINDSIRKRLNLLKEKVPSTLEDYGNTSSASIPFTIVSELRQELALGKHMLLLSGFGVGLSWGNAIIHTEDLLCLPLIKI